MTKRVLDVGNCAYDHRAIRSMIENAFDAEVVQAHDSRDAMDALSRSVFDLVLINRRLDRDGSDGLDLLRKIRSRPEGASPPVMLVTNYAEHQEAAVAAGAAPGFGKGELNEPGTREKLEKFLA